MVLKTQTLAHDKFLLYFLESIGWEHGEHCVVDDKTWRSPGNFV
ncbi:hypothetical protein [Desulforhabdus amnigena]|jgi:hypothetical protein|nr:hypothetical protein [Desulforhabdus amnigena]